MENRLEELVREIAHAREALIEHALFAEQLTDAQIVKKSQELDLLITEYQLLSINQ
jgi:hypothetical protein